MTDTQLALLVAALGALVLGLTWWASRHNARTRATREGREFHRAAIRGRLEDLSGLDDLMDVANAAGAPERPTVLVSGPADAAVPVHTDCLRYHRRGFTSHVCAHCRVTLDREAAR